MICPKSVIIDRNHNKWCFVQKSTTFSCFVNNWTQMRFNAFVGNTAINCNLTIVRSWSFATPNISISFMVNVIIGRNQSHVLILVSSNSCSNKAPIKWNRFELDEIFVEISYLFQSKNSHRFVFCLHFSSSSPIYSWRSRLITLPESNDTHYNLESCICLHDECLVMNAYLHNFMKEYAKKKSWVSEYVRVRNRIYAFERKWSWLNYQFMYSNCDVCLDICIFFFCMVDNHMVIANIWPRECRD